MYSRGTNPSLNTLTRLCGAFGITLAEFFNEESESSFTTEELNIIDNYRKLTVEEKRAVSIILKKLNR